MTNDWIAVTERLPDTMQKIDVWIEKERWPHRLTNCFMDRKKVFCKAGEKSEWIKLENVTHWMPLPAPQNTKIETP